MTYDELVEKLEKEQKKIESDIKKAFNKVGVPIVDIELDLGSLMMGEPWIHTHAEIDESIIGEENGEE